MRKIAVWTTTAMVALMGAASAQTTETASAQAGAPGEMATAIAAYAAYHNDVSELRASRMANANELEAALDRVARHNRDALARGWVAYGGMTAAQSPAFVRGVREAADYYGRDAVIWALSVDPSYARGLRGGQEVTRMLLDSAAADASRIVNVADRYQELAYGLQRQRWANAVAPQQAARVQRIRTLGRPDQPIQALPSEMSPRLSVATLSISGSDPTAFGGRRFWDALRGGPEVTEVSATQATYQWRINPTRGMAVDRMASLGALQALDAVNTHQSAASALMSDQRSRDCIEMAQLQLYQCMSAARFRYENAFCLGQHGLRDVGTCISAVATPPEGVAMSTPANRH
jgi:ribosomal protein S18 acetylase RimI-like enzyme